MDGNMKNHRDVCLATEAGYAKFNGLPGKVKTGCPNTPHLNSRFCSVHTPTAFNPEGESTAAVNVETKGQHKKTTRNTTFYQASLNSTYICTQTHC